VVEKDSTGGGKRLRSPWGKKRREVNHKGTEWGQDRTIGKKTAVSKEGPHVQAIEKSMPGALKLLLTRAKKN